MSRLASGTKTEVSKKEMKKLTTKNYENLPEVKKKREEESKHNNSGSEYATTLEDTLMPNWNTQ